MALSATLDLARRRVGPDDRDQLFLAHRPVALGDEEGEREPPLPPGEVALLDECLAVLDRDSPGQVDAQRSPRFCQAPGKVPEIECAYITDYRKELSCRKSSIARAGTS